jgi:hypothetical protein
MKIMYLWASPREKNEYKSSDYALYFTRNKKEEKIYYMARKD